MISTIQYLNTGPWLLVTSHPCRTTGVGALGHWALGNPVFFDQKRGEGKVER